MRIGLSDDQVDYRKDMSDFRSIEDSVMLTVTVRCFIYVLAVALPSSDVDQRNDIEVVSDRRAVCVITLSMTGDAEEGDGRST